MLLLLQQYQDASRRALVWGCLMAAVAWPQAAPAQGVTATLSVQALVAQADGRLARQPAEQARPGDLLQYQAVYRNGPSSVARSVQATVPIPPGTVYEPAAAERMAPLASVDGQRFEPTPLQRQVRQPDGQWQRQPVPLADYRFLRWPLGDLAQGQSVTVSARAKVLSATQASAEPQALRRDDTGRQP